MRLLTLLLLLVTTGCNGGKDDTAVDGDADGDGYLAPDDCDDTNPDINPDAAEVCDGVDDNCDGVADDGLATSWYADADGDGFGNLAAETMACAAPVNTVADATDCDDTSAAWHPGAAEADCADPNDYNCDGSVAFRDGDSDGDAACTDCDDADPALNASAAELCDGVDNDCDGATDEDATDATTWYADTDADGYGDPGTSTPSCSMPAGQVADATDCDDTNVAVNPAADEVCNSDDDDCDGAIDEDGAVDAGTWYADADGDGYGDSDVSIVSCDAPSGFVADGDDCDDGDAAILECSGAFDGTYSGVWETLTASGEDTYSLMTYHSLDIPYLYNMYDATGQSYDPATDTWTTLAASAPYSAPWCTMAPVGEDLWMIRNSSVYQYVTATDTWNTVASTTAAEDYGMTESDEDGVVYGHDANGYIVSYDTTTGSLTYSATGLGSEYETRLGYDPGERAIFFGAYNAAALYRWDIATGAVTTMSSIPESQLNDIYCSDRSGHIYAAGGTSGLTMFQYDIATDTWAAMTDLPTDHGNNGSCTVSADGYLYVGTGSNRTFYRMELY
jgi:hypothetical protein